MSFCIFTIIKNEQLYLDEGIRYHLNLGANHIFIFEDIGSQSHDQVVNKYSPDKVSLLPIFYILNINQQNEAIDLKRTRKYNVQHLYGKAVLDSLSESPQYDGCFYIDIDEFLTPQDSQVNFISLLDKYEDYDAVLIPGQCFGASNHVTQPDYHQQGVLDYYKIPMQGKLPDNPVSFTKVCYNLKRYQHKFFFNQHHVTKYCHNTSIKEIYIRHYVTRSGEEFVGKRMIRGYFFGGTRPFDMFFEANPEFANQRDSLLKMLKEILVVLPYSQRGSQGTELRLALKGGRKFCKFKYHFVVIGEFNEELQEEFPGVEWIAAPNKTPIAGQYNPHLDIQHKMEIAYERFYPQYLDFIYMVDDNYAIKPFTLGDILKPHYLQTSFVGVEKLPTSFWKHDKWKTRQLLDRHNLPHINYTTHFPCIFNFEKFHELGDKFDMRNESYVPEDVYFNAVEHEEPVLAKTIRLGIWNKEIFNNEFETAIDNPNIKFICNSVEGGSPELEQALGKLIDN